MAFRSATYKISRLHLDIANPRMRRAPNETTAQERLLEGFGDSITILGRDIADNGLSPLDQWAVVRENNKLVVLEGNRRLTACRLLLNPEKTKNETIRRRFNNIRVRVPDARFMEAHCVLFDTREEAAHWIELKHHGAAEGAGVAKWGPEMVYLNQRAQGQKRIAWHELWIGLEDAYGSDPDFSEALQAARRSQYTLMERLVDAGLLEMLGVEWADGDLNGSIGVRERLLLLAMFHDMSGSSPTLNSRTINDVPAATKALADYQRRVDEIDLDADSESEDQQDNQPADPEPAPRGEADPQPEPSPTPRPRRNNHLLRGARFTAFPERIRRLADQGQKLRLNGQDELCGITMRVLVDLCTSEYWKACMPGAVESKLDKRTRAVILHLDPNIEGRVEVRNHPGLSDAWSMFRTDRTDSGKLIQSLNDWVHNPQSTGQVPMAAAMSDALGPLFTLMSDEMRTRAVTLSAEPETLNPEES